MRSLIAILAGFAASSAAFAASSVDYMREVKPVLAAHCYKCHGALDQQHGLRVDTAANLLKGGKRGPAIKPGDPSNSLIIHALRGTDADLGQMPRKSPSLSEAQIEVIARWITEGAKAPVDEKAHDPVQASRSHWSFVPPKRPTVPKVQRLKAKDPSAIDAFIMERLVKEGVKPSPEADRYTLIRRLSLDLTGLLPTVAEVDAFVSDTRPNAYEKLVDRLLESPHYGERWGRWWLDVARYADSNGYSIDAPRQIWLYRDWVINAMNRNMPFDQFVIEQLAGDMLPGATTDQKIATGFHRNTQINQEGGIDKEQFRVESIIDRLATTGAGLLGLSINCAQCHDHKYDPISQREYYQLFAFFNNQDEPNLELPDKSVDQAALDAEIKELSEDIERYLGTKAAFLAKEEGELSDARRSKLKSTIQKALKVDPSKRSLKEARTVYAALAGNDQEFKAKNSKLEELETGKSRKLSTMVMAERKEPRDSFVFIKGDFTRHGDPVKPGTPVILHEFKATNPNRLDFARWMMSTENPLTARVMVNRIWQQYFGKGLVETENDFGTQGQAPSHPELLDWLAMEFMFGDQAGGGSATPRWSIKHIHKLIVMSETYRRSSNARPDLSIKDPNNKLLSHQNRLRLDAEIVRDVALSASGLLTDTIGGPSVYPPQPDGVLSLGQVKREWKANKDANRYRRGMYTFLFRATPYPALSVFDAPDTFSACTRRPRSNTPLQALTLLNDQAYFECAEAFGKRITADGPSDDAARINRAFRICLARQPSAEETATLKGVLANERGNADSQTRDSAPWAMVARVLLNLDETITRE